MDTPLVETVEFRGHPNVSAIHRTTLEVTTEAELTPRGHCIIGVSADKGAAGLSDAMKAHIRAGGRLRFELRVGGHTFEFEGWGSRHLELSDATSIVIRRSSFVSPRTVAIRSTAAAADVPRAIVSELRGGARGLLIISAMAPDPIRGTS
ncbi:MAG: DUF371 domain-containing protein [Nitrososphaeria archaeon]